jgi:NADH dehydrogenase
MILITGSTGFIGNILVRHLSDLGYPLKLLIRPSDHSPKLPKGIPLDVTVAGLQDEKGLRAAMKGVDVVYHLASAEAQGRRADLNKVDIQGTLAITQAAKQAKVSRLFYLSHLDADRASAFPLLKAKGIAEHFIRQSGLPYTIFRSAIAYGEGDRSSTNLARLLKRSPGLVFLPEGGRTQLQPIWVEDLVTVLTWALDMESTIDETIKIGGPEYLTFREICKLITAHIGIKRAYVDTSPIFLNILTEFMEILRPGFPTSVFWLDYLATDRTTSLDVLPTRFDLLPAKMSQRLGYLDGMSFRKKSEKRLKKNRKNTLRKKKL